MEQRRTTGKFDSKGLEIFEGDKVIQSWGWFHYQGKQYTNYRVATITVNPAHMMANGQMHDDGEGIIFNVGSAYNFWEGKDVTKLTVEELEGFDIPEGALFFFYEKKPVKFTDQHLMNLTNEEWKLELEQRHKAEHALFFGTKNYKNGEK